MNPTTEPNAPSAHTKTPWGIEPVRFNDSGPRIAAENSGLNGSQVVCECFGPDAEANAVHVLHCVNSHDALVAALKALLWHEIHGEAESHRQGNPRHIQRLEIARAALALAGEEGK